MSGSQGTLIVGYYLSCKSRSNAGKLIVIESFGLLYVRISHPGLNGYTGLHTFVFDMLIFRDRFNILVVREKNYF